MKTKVVKKAKTPKRPTCKRIGKFTLVKKLSARLDDLMQKFEANQKAIDTIMEAQAELFGAMNEESTLIMDIEFDYPKAS